MTSEELARDLRHIAAWHTPGGPTPTTQCPPKWKVCAQAADAIEVLAATVHEPETIYALADKFGHRFRTADEEGVQFDKHALLDFARALAPPSTPTEVAK